MPRPVSSCCLLLLFLSAVFRWEAALVTMWSQMIMERSAERPFSQAVGSTLSGQEPCGQCIQITREWSEASDETLVPRAAEFSAAWCLLPACALPLPGMPAATDFADWRAQYPSLFLRPLTPPPRHLQTI